MIRPSLAALLVGLGLAVPAAAEDKGQPELLPLPRVAPAEAATPMAPPSHFRVNRWDVWQYYGVDRSGHFRPRVIYAPGGAYYSHTGEPYPWVSTHMRDFMPYVAD